MRWLVDTNSNLQVNLIHILSDFWVLLVAILLIFFWLFWVYKKNIQYKEIALMIFYSIGFSFLIYLILNQFLPPRARPEDVSLIPPLLEHLPDNSFPSWHAIFAWAAVLATFLYQKRKCLSYIVLIFSVLMLICRIFAWVHYPWDIVVWFIVWLAWACVVYYYRESQLFKKYLLPYPIKLASYLKL